MKRKIIGTLLFMFLAAAGLSAFSERDSFEGFQEFSFFMGDSMVSYYVGVDTIRIKNRSSFFNSEESINFRTVKNAILQRSEKSQYNKRVSERNSKLKLSRYFSDNFKRSLGSRANRYDKELYFRKECEHGVPYLYYTESDTRFVESEELPWGAAPVETQASDSVEKRRCSSSPIISFCSSMNTAIFIMA